MRTDFVDDWNYVRIIRRNQALWQPPGQCQMVLQFLFEGVGINGHGPLYRRSARRRWAKLYLKECAQSMEAFHNKDLSRPERCGTVLGRARGHEQPVFAFLYNFTRRHEALDMRTPAQALGVADKRWSLPEVILKARGTTATTSTLRWI